MVEVWRICAVRTSVETKGPDRPWAHCTRAATRIDLVKNDKENKMTSNPTCLPATLHATRRRIAELYRGK